MCISNTCSQLLTNAHRITAEEKQPKHTNNNRNPIFVLSHPLLYRGFFLILSKIHRLLHFFFEINFFLMANITWWYITFCVSFDTLQPFMVSTAENVGNSIFIRNYFGFGGFFQELFSSLQENNWRRLLKEVLGKWDMGNPLLENPFFWNLISFDFF